MFFKQQNLRIWCLHVQSLCKHREWASHFITFNSETKSDFGQKRSSTQLCIYMQHITGSSIVFICNFEYSFFAVPQSCQQISPRKHKLGWLKVFFQKDQRTWADVSPVVVKLRLHTADTASSPKLGSVAQKQQWATQHRGQLQHYVYTMSGQSHHWPTWHVFCQKI